MGETEREEFKNWFIGLIQNLKELRENQEFCNEAFCLLGLNDSLHLSNKAFDKCIEVFEPVLTEESALDRKSDYTKYSFIFEEIEVFTLVRE